jgi:ribonuclease VapC
VKPILADASAVLAYLQFEPGGEAVAQYLPDVRLTAVNLAEVVTVLTLRDIAKDWIESRVLQVFSNVIPLDREQAALTGYLTSLTRKHGLSLGDRACLAAGILLKARVLTTDAAWQRLPLDLDILLLR